MLIRVAECTAKVEEVPVVERVLVSSIKDKWGHRE